MEWKKIIKKSKSMVILLMIALLLQSAPLIASVSINYDYLTVVGQWAFFEGQGTTTADLSGNGNTGTISGATWVKGIIGEALSFDGNDYVEIPHKSNLNPRTAITVEAWVDPAVNTVWQRVISKSTYPNTDYCLFSGDKNNIGFSIKMGNINQTVYSAADSVPIGVWTYVVGTYDGTRVRLYINGKQVNSIAVSGQINAHEGPLRIGGDPKGDYFKGIIDQVSIYNKALTATEILSRYQEFLQLAAPQVFNITTTKDGTKLFIHFDKEMAVPPTAPAGFTVTGNEDKPIQKVRLNTNDKAIIELTLSKKIFFNEEVRVSYTAGKVTAADRGILADFSNYDVKNNSTVPFSGEWHFNEGEGTIAKDTSGNDNNGTVSGATWVRGEIGKALSFDGNDYVEIPHHASLNPRSALTITAWVNPARNKLWQRIVSKSAYPNTDYCLFGGDKNNIAFSIKMGNINQTVYSAANSVPIGVWTYVVGTYDGTRIRLYINGKQVNSAAVSGQINAHTGALRIGGDPKGDYFQGMIDEVQIYNEPLTPQQILQRYEDSKIDSLTFPIISGGHGHSITAKEHGTVWTWGVWGFSEWEPGDNEPEEIITKPEQISRLTGVIATSAGLDHSLALKRDGTVWAWGGNWYVNWGSSVPKQVQGLTGVTAIAAGWCHSLALKQDGTMWAWGGNWNGERGDGTRDWEPILEPVQVKGLTGVKAIAAGNSFSLALKEDGTVWAWGANSAGEIGDGTRETRYEPVQVSGLTEITAIATGASSSHSLALKEDGTVWAWGTNNSGQIGDGTRGDDRLIPVQVKKLTGVTAIAAGANHSLALKEDATLWAWGANYSGQLGDGTTNNDRLEAEQVGSLTAIRAIGAGNAQSFAIKEDGTAWAWGANRYGQLGDGTTEDKAFPVQVKF